jgi:hypothetical protein
MKDSFDRTVFIPSIIAGMTAGHMRKENLNDISGQMSELGKRNNIIGIKVFFLLLKMKPSRVNAT